MYMNSQMLNLAQLSQDIYAAKMQYQCLHMQELEMMRAVVEDEHEETQVSLSQMEHQIGQICKQLYDSGGITACRKTGQWSCLFNGTTSHASGFDRFSCSFDTPHPSVSISSSSPPSPAPVKVD